MKISTKFDIGQEVFRKSGQTWTKYYVVAMTFRMIDGDRIIEGVEVVEYECHLKCGNGMQVGIGELYSRDDALREYWIDRINTHAELFDTKSEVGGGKIRIN